MHKWFIVFGLLVAGCGDGGGEACTVNMDSRCNGEVVEFCDGEVWVETTDCGVAEEMCMQDPAMANGDAHCMGGAM